MITMLERRHQINSKKPKSKKPKQQGYRELLSLSREELETYREFWLNTVRYVTDCSFNGKLYMIRIIDLISLRPCAVFTIKKEFVQSSRIIKRIEDDYRVKIDLSLIHDTYTTIFKTSNRKTLLL